MKKTHRCVCIFLFLPLTVFSQKDTRTALVKEYYHKGEIAYSKNRIDEAFAYFDSSFNAGNKYAVDYYNVACVASLSDKLDLASDYLSRSISLGFLDLYICTTDEDLSNLTADSIRWPILVNRVNKKLDSISGEFKKINNYDYNKVFPFMKNHLWGVFDIVSGEIILKPSFANCALVSDGILIEDAMNQELFFNARGELIREADFRNHYAYYFIDRYPFQKIEMVQKSNNNNFKGFNFNNTRDTIFFSDIYDGHTYKPFNVGHPFLLNKHFFLPAYNNIKWGIIDSTGKPLNNFNFIYDNLVLNSVNNKINWFYYEKENEMGFIDENGRKWKKKLLSYPYSSNDIARVNLQKKNLNGVTYFGLLDYENLNWIFEPASLEQISTNAGLGKLTIVGHAVRLIKIGKSGHRFKKEGYLICKKEGKAGYMDSNFKFYYPK